jgi:hypothetical protein
LKNKNKTDPSRFDPQRYDNILYHDSFEWQRKSGKPNKKRGPFTGHGANEELDKLNKKESDFNNMADKVSSDLKSLGKPSNIPDIRKRQGNFNDGGPPTIGYSRPTKPLNSTSSDNQEVKSMHNSSSTNYTSGRGRNQPSRGRGPQVPGDPPGAGTSTALNAKNGGSGSGSSWYGGNAYSKGPKKLSINVKSGLTLDQNPTNLHGHSSLYVAQGVFFELFEYDWTKLGTLAKCRIEDSTSIPDTYFRQLVTTDIYTEYLHQIEVVRNRDAGRHFTKEKFIKYFDSVVQALQMFYCLDSILSYDSDASKFNAGMLYLRERMSSEVVGEYANLKRCLERQVMKPEIVDFICYMYGNFNMHAGKYAPVIKMSYYDILADFNPLDSQVDYLKNPVMIRYLIDQVNEDFSGAFSFMAGGYPQYKLIGKLPSVATEPTTSSDFNTWWHNSDYTWPIIDEEGAIKEVKHSRSAVSATADIYYGVYGDDVNGILHACSSVLIGVANHEPGMYRPIYKHREFRDTDKFNSCSLKFYRPNASSAKLVAAKAEYGACASADIYKGWYHKQADVVTEMSQVPAGVQRILGHSVESLKQCVFDSVRVLVHPGL